MSTPAITAPTGVRRTPRFRVNFPIKLFANVQQRRCAIQGRSHDLSMLGMAIYIPAELESGQTVQIEFVIPNTNQRLGVNAIVRNSQGFRCGVEFQNLTPLDESGLTKLCAKLEAEAASNPPA
ncbi:MAG: PilZ domain-containing protein [Acidobacteria bacterium]|nr:PilZ domain-containing protein [Acidobacteriota bacterium]